MKRILFALMLLMGGISISAQSTAIYGDVNNDGIVNHLDVNAISDIIMGKAASTESADVNKDAKVNARDIVTVVNVINENKIKDAEQYAIILSPSITDADILVYNIDGSYILLKKENESGYGWIYFNSSVENESQDGVTILIGDDGKPVMLTTPDEHMIFNNVTEDCFDFALVKPNEKLRIFRDVRIADGMPKLAKARGLKDWVEPWTVAWNSLWYDIHNNWDEHNKKALLPYITKVLAMTLATGGTFGVGFFITVIVEGAKSMDKECIFTDILGAIGIFNFEDGKELINKYSLLSYGANWLAGKRLEELGRMKEWVGPNLKSEEFKIKLSKNPLECSCEEKWHTDVIVNSKATWKINDANVDKNWCEVLTSSDQVLVHVNENKSIEERSCSVVVSAEYTTEIESVILGIRQYGNELGLKPVTQGVEEVGETTAKVCGKIEGYNLLDETVRFGLAFTEVGISSPDGYGLDANSIDDMGNYSVTFVALKPNTTYKYYAYLNFDGKTYYGEKKEFTTKDDNRMPYGVITENGTHLTYYYDENKNEHMEEIVNVPYNPATTYSCQDIQEVTFDASFYDYEPTSTEFWFCNMGSLTTITNLQYLNTRKVTNMNWMFSGCTSLTSLDLSNLNTTNVTSMYEMFKNCKSLSNLDLSNFDTENVTTMWGMFRNCSSLSTLDISNFDIENVINISYMFADCSSLKSINVSGLNTKNLTFMGHVFEGCSSLTYLDLSSFNTTTVTGMPNMFNSCHSLITIDLSSFNTDNVTDMTYMFYGCSSLETIYARNWKSTSGYDNGSMMFSGCEKLTGGNGTKIGNNLYGYDKDGNPLYYYCPDDRRAAHIDGGKDNPGLFTAK